MSGRLRRSVHSFREAQRAFAGLMGKLAARPEFRTELAAIAERRAALNRDSEEGTWLALEEVARPLADFLQAVCGDMAPEMAGAAESILYARLRPFYRKVMGKAPPARRVPLALRRTELAKRLGEAADRLRPVVQSIGRREDECMAALRRLAMPGWRAIARKMPGAVDDWLGEDTDEMARLELAFDWWLAQKGRRRR